MKINWARGATLWTSKHPGRWSTPTARRLLARGQVIVNYEALDRHVGWLGVLGLREVVEHAHYIKNPESQWSQNLLQLSERIRTPPANPLPMAPTGALLINDTEDFTAIWKFLS